MNTNPWTLSGNGNCYEAAVHLAMKLTEGPDPLGVSEDHFTLIHGLVTGTGGEAEGIRYGHAWIEMGASVLDASNGTTKCIPKGLYYRAGNISRDETYRYTWGEAKAALLEHKTYGPWHTTEES